MAPLGFGNDDFAYADLVGGLCLERWGEQIGPSVNSIQLYPLISSTETRFRRSNNCLTVLSEMRSLSMVHDRLFPLAPVEAWRPISRKGELIADGAATCRYGVVDRHGHGIRVVAFVDDVLASDVDHHLTSGGIGGLFGGGLRGAGRAHGPSPWPTVVPFSKSINGRAWRTTVTSRAVWP